MLFELSKFGVESQVGENHVEIKKCRLHKPAEPLHGHNDHRIVMSLAVLLTAFGGSIEGSEAVNKSFPSFFEKLEKTGIKVENYA
jgi:3-phosphoshikimate 1-carboxyvinyltransferase